MKNIKYCEMVEALDERVEDDYEYIPPCKHLGGVSCRLHNEPISEIEGYIVACSSCTTPVCEGIPEGLEDRMKEKDNE